MPSPISRLAAATHAERLVAELDDTTRGLLAEDTAEAVRELFGITVEVNSAGTLQSACGVHGRYYPTDPPRIEIEASASRRRDRFTVLHELGHDRIRYDYNVADEFDMLDRDSAYRSRELVADAFASRILIPDEAVAVAFADGVTAPAVAELFAATNASREACAVRAADALGQPGVVMLGRENVAVFTAHRSTPWWVARNTVQPDSSILRRAAAYEGRAQGASVIRFATGNLGPELHADAVCLGDGWVFAVLTTIRPPGGGLSVAVGDPVEPDDVECPVCDTTFRPYGKPHACGDYICPQGHCSCSTGPSTRLCTICFLQKAVNLFEPAGTVCSDCR